MDELGVIKSGSGNKFKNFQAENNTLKSKLSISTHRSHRNAEEPLKWAFFDQYGRPKTTKARSKIRHFQASSIGGRLPILFRKTIALIMFTKPFIGSISDRLLTPPVRYAFCRQPGKNHNHTASTPSCLWLFQQKTIPVEGILRRITLGFLNLVHQNGRHNEANTLR